LVAGLEVEVESIHQNAFSAILDQVAQVLAQIGLQGPRDVEAEVLLNFELGVKRHEVWTQLLREVLTLLLAVPAVDQDLAAAGHKVAEVVAGVGLVLREGQAAVDGVRPHQGLGVQVLIPVGLVFLHPLVLQALLVLLDADGQLVRDHGLE